MEGEIKAINGLKKNIEWRFHRSRIGEQEDIDLKEMLTVPFLAVVVATSIYLVVGLLEYLLI